MNYYVMAAGGVVLIVWVIAWSLCRAAKDADYKE